MRYSVWSCSGFSENSHVISGVFEAHLSWSRPPTSRLSLHLRICDLSVSSTSFLCALCVCWCVLYPVQKHGGKLPILFFPHKLFRNWIESVYKLVSVVMSGHASLRCIVGNIFIFLGNFVGVDMKRGFVNNVICTALSVFCTFGVDTHACFYNLVQLCKCKHEHAVT